jgi:TolA-binding protein
MRQRGYFIPAILFTMVFIFIFILSFDRHYSDSKFHEKTIMGLKEKALRQDLKISAQKYQIQTQKGLLFQERAPASTIKALLDGESLSVEIQSKRLFSQMKSLFQKKECLKLLSVFKSLEEDYSFASFYPEAVLLKADCLIQMGEYEESLVSYSFLIEQFPDHATTGHGILKMAEVLKILDRTTEALEVLKILKAHFSDHADLLQAAENMALDLGKIL